MVGIGVFDVSRISHTLEGGADVLDLADCGQRKLDLMLTGCDGAPRKANDLLAECRHPFFPGDISAARITAKVKHLLQMQKFTDVFRERLRLEEELGQVCSRLEILNLIDKVEILVEKVS